MPESFSDELKAQLVKLDYLFPETQTGVATVYYSARGRFNEECYALASFYRGGGKD